MTNKVGIKKKKYHLSMAALRLILEERISHIEESEEARREDAVQFRKTSTTLMADVSRLNQKVKELEAKNAELKANLGIQEEHNTRVATDLNTRVSAMKDLFDLQAAGKLYMAPKTEPVKLTVETFSKLALQGLLDSPFIRGMVLDFRRQERTPDDFELKDILAAAPSEFMLKWQLEFILFGFGYQMKEELLVGFQEVATMAKMPCPLQYKTDLLSRWLFQALANAALQKPITRNGR